MAKDAILLGEVVAPEATTIEIRCGRRELILDRSRALAHFRTALLRDWCWML